MRNIRQQLLAFTVLTTFAVFVLMVLLAGPAFERKIDAKELTPSTSLGGLPTPTPGIDLRAEVAKLRASIKGKEKLPAGEVFKNLKIMNKFPAQTVLNIMAGGFSRSLGVNCAHCHTPGKWESDSKPAKQVARDMWAMQAKINGELLTAIPGLKDRRAIVNCTTCHRGSVKPATNMRRRAPKPAPKKATE